MSAVRVYTFGIGLLALSCTEKVAETGPSSTMNAGSGGAATSGSGGTGAVAAGNGGGGNSAGSAGASAGGGGGTGGVAGSGGSENSAGSAGTGGSGGTGGAPSTESATLQPDPSWTCGMPDGVPPPALGEPVFTATLELGETHEVGATPYGTRRLLDVGGGTFTGERIQGTVLEGGLELELTLENAAMELEGINVLRTGDGALVYVRSCGFSAPNDTSGRIVLDFEVATSSSYAWLNEGKYAAERIVNAVEGTVELAVYDISAVAPGEPLVTLEDPPAVPDQPWECSTQTGTKGAAVFTENVTLGSSLSVGASKRGTRNIIPITGGTVSGNFTGSVVPGGADYQLLGGATQLDARYTLVSDAGDYVIVRNCGPIGALVPLFEARKDGPLAFLNENTYLSSDPGAGAGGVSITFYERQ
jgi:hypothetical protein